jgi:hypothetical protein
VLQNLSVNSGLKAAGAVVFCWIYAEPDALFGVHSVPIVPKFVPKFSRRISLPTEGRSTPISAAALLHLTNRWINSLFDSSKMSGCTDLQCTEFANTSVFRGTGSWRSLMVSVIVLIVFLGLFHAIRQPNATH